jgi:hypothetical protein
MTSSLLVVSPSSFSLPSSLSLYILVAVPLLAKPSSFSLPSSISLYILVANPLLANQPSFSLPSSISLYILVANPLLENQRERQLRSRVRILERGRYREAIGTWMGDFVCLKSLKLVESPKMELVWLLSTDSLSFTSVLNHKREDLTDFKFLL